MCGFCNVCVCVCMGGFCNVWVCVCVGFVMCVCVCTYVYTHEDTMFRQKERKHNYIFVLTHFKTY
jgi:hypothetical protein